MDFQILTGEDLITAILPEWNVLQGRSARTIFTGPVWCMSWWRFIGKEAGFRLHVVAGRKDGKLAAIAPLAVRHRSGLRLLQWAGGDVCDYSDFLLEDAGDAAALLDAVRKSPHHDLAHIKEVHEGAACLPALERIGREVKASEARCIRVETPGFDAWFATLPYAMRKQYRARLKQAQAKGELRYEVFHESVPDSALAALIEQKSQWLVEHGRKGVFDAPGVTEFFRAIAEDHGNEGSLHFSTLSCGEEIIATHMGFIQGDRFLSYMPSYSAGWSAVSPGRLMMFACIRWAFENGLREYDFMRGEEGYKHSFANGMRTMQDFMFARTWRGKLAQFFYLRRAAR